MDRFNKLPRMGRWILLGMLLGACLTLASAITAQEPVEDPEAEQTTDSGADSQSSPKTGESSSEAPQDDDDEEEELRQFTPSEQIRADSEVKFPADI